jgi:shikimate kinase
MTNYEVGQIIYTILEEKQLVLPVQVVEQVVVKNLTGEETNYKVLLPNKKKQKVSIERLQKLFNSVDEVSNYLLENVKKAIEIMASDACSLEK